MSVNEAPPLKIRGTGDPTNRTFCVGNQDHTIGNALRHVLLQNGKVDFAGYSVPHPAEPVVNIRVQTHAPTTAVQALHESCETLHNQCSVVLERMMEKLPEIKQDREEVEKKLEVLMVDMDDDGNTEEGDGSDADAMEED
ncbi:MAG: hypothetical protein SGARI_003684 [Bacillariaceae sp.]